MSSHMQVLAQAREGELFFIEGESWEDYSKQLLLLLLSRFSRVRLCATP